jgi:hypothetical protein
MKKLIFVAVVSALSAAATAQTIPALDAVQISGATARIELPAQLRNMWYDEFDQVKGTYYLSNGKAMQLSLWGNRMYAKIDGMKKAQLVAVSPYVFVALDKRMKIMIEEPGASSVINAELLLAVPLQSNAAPGNEMVRLLARR